MTETPVILSNRTFYWLHGLLIRASRHEDDFERRIALEADARKCRRLAKDPAASRLFDGDACRRIRTAIRATLPTMPCETQAERHALEVACAIFDAHDTFRTPTPVAVSGADGQSEHFIRVPLSKADVARLSHHFRQAKYIDRDQRYTFLYALNQHANQTIAPKWLVLRFSLVRQMREQLEKMSQVGTATERFDMHFFYQTLTESATYARHEPDYLRLTRKEHPDMPSPTRTINPSRSMASTLAYVLHQRALQLPASDIRERHELDRLGKRYFALSMRTDTTYDMAQPDVEMSLEVIRYALKKNVFKLKRGQRELLLKLEQYLDPTTVIPAHRLPKNADVKSVFSLKLHPNEANALIRGITHWVNTREDKTYYEDRALYPSVLLDLLQTIAGAGDERQLLHLAPDNAALLDDILRATSIDPSLALGDRNIASHALRLLRGQMQRQASLLELSLPDVTRLLQALKTAPGTPSEQTAYDRIRANIENAYPYA